MLIRLNGRLRWEIQKQQAKADKKCKRISFSLLLMADHAKRNEPKHFLQNAMWTQGVLVLDAALLLADDVHCKNKLSSATTKKTLRRLYFLKGVEMGKRVKDDTIQKDLFSCSAPSVAKWISFDQYIFNRFEKLDTWCHMLTLPFLSLIRKKLPHFKNSLWYF